MLKCYTLLVVDKIGVIGISFDYMKTTHKICIYTRVSKTDGSQDVARQVNDLKEFAKSQNWEVVFEVEEKINLQE